MGGRGHGPGVTGLDRVCHAVQGEDPSRALIPALQPVNPRTKEKNIYKFQCVWFCDVVGGHTELAFWELKKCRAELFLHFFFQSIIPSNKSLMSLQLGQSYD